jgi:murein DD-endopeptidase MepM/ murein hydrolase activator NlpD
LAISLYLGAVFVPLSGKANFFSSVFSKASAENTNPLNLGLNSDNSQTMALLQANSLSAMGKKQSKPDKDSKDSEGEEVDQDSDINIISQNALLPAATPLTGLGGPDISDSASDDQISVYVVRKGDSLSQIASMFGVSVNTILWANDMKKGDKLTEGEILLILPISGLEHTVTRGQTLQSIAKLYKADIDEITNFNGLAKGAKLAIGDKLMIPNAQKSEESSKPVQNLSASIAKDNQYYVNHPVQNLSGYYVNPVPGARKSQGIHDRNGIDLAISKGTAIYAAAAGKVKLARVGYNGGFGNLVIISHPNGTETLYAHQSSIATYTGASVTQGQVIGYVGSTGRSTGPHLHFEVHGARNPGSDGSWAK